MLSSKLKSWVESHLTRKNKSAEQRQNNNNNNNNRTGSSGTGPAHGSLASVAKEVDRIAHPAAGLVNLVPAVPLCSSNGRRSNAGVVIRLQNDFAAAAASAAGASGSTRRHRHPSWTQSPVMLAWNTKLSRVQQHQQQQQQQQQPRSVFEPPLSPSPPPPSASSTIQQKCSPTGSDWTQSTQSFAADSGCGEEGTLSSTADLAPGSSATPTLSSPESAYSTGCSDGVSPVSRDDAIFEPLVAVQQQHKEPVAPWRRSLFDNEASASSTATQSPARTRPAIRTNPWLPVRTSLTSTSDRASWMTDATPDTGLSELPASLKETDIVSSSDSDDVMRVESLSSALALADRQMDMLCNSLEQLMDEQELRRSFRRKCPPSPPSRARTEQETSRCWNADDQYSQLIRQTEEILLQLENDELLLGANRKQPEVEREPSARKAPASGSVAVRRRLRKTRRRCSSRSSARDVGAYSTPDDSTSDSSDCCDYSAMASTRAAYRQPARRASSSVAGGAKVSARFANRNGRLTTAHQVPPRLDRWLANSQRTSCTPDVGFGEHDRPPSPAPMDPHCHWPSAPPSGQRPASGHHRRSCRQHSSAAGPGGPALGSAGSCPASPAVGYSRQCQWRHQQQHQQQSVNREQQRLESQIAFLRQQLKDVTDDYYYDRLGNTPSSSE